jgi:hypothetical protein
MAEVPQGLRRVEKRLVFLSGIALSDAGGKPASFKRKIPGDNTGVGRAVCGSKVCDSEPLMSRETHSGGATRVSLNTWYGGDNIDHSQSLPAGGGAPRTSRTGLAGAFASGERIRKAEHSSKRWCGEARGMGSL